MPPAGFRTPAEIIVSASNRERHLTKDTVAWIEWIEKSPDSVADGAGVGAILGVPMGLMGAAFGQWWGVASPYTTSLTLAWTSAPTHVKQGSSVT